MNEREWASLLVDTVVRRKDDTLFVITGDVTRGDSVGYCVREIRGSLVGRTTTIYTAMNYDVYIKASSRWRDLASGEVVTASAVDARTQEILLDGADGKTRSYTFTQELFLTDFEPLTETGSISIGSIWCDNPVRHGTIRIDDVTTEGISFTSTRGTGIWLAGTRAFLKVFRREADFSPRPAVPTDAEIELIPIGSTWVGPWGVLRHKKTSKKAISRIDKMIATLPKPAREVIRQKQGRMCNSGPLGIACGLPLNHRGACHYVPEIEPGLAMCPVLADRHVYDPVHQKYLSTSGCGQWVTDDNGDLFICGDSAYRITEYLDVPRLCIACEGLAAGPDQADAFLSRYLPAIAACQIKGAEGTVNEGRPAAVSGSDDLLFHRGPGCGQMLSGGIACGSMDPPWPMPIFCNACWSSDPHGGAGSRKDPST